MKTAFIVKGLIKNKPALLREIREHFPDAEIYETLHPFHATELARNAAEKNCSFLIATGGDGTLNEVVNGLLSSAKESLPVLGLLPYGTANDFSKTTRFTGGLVHLKMLIEKNSFRKIDAGKISFLNDRKERQERYFINISDVGIGGYIVEKINRRSKFLGPDLLFFSETLKALLFYNKIHLNCKSRDFEWEGKALAVVVANGNYFGSGLCIAPHASLSDGKFGIVIFGNVTIFDYLKNLGKMNRGEKIQHPEVFYMETDEMEIIPVETQCPIDMDGEFIGYAPAGFKILPGKIKFLIK